MKLSALERMGHRVSMVATWYLSQRTNSL